MVLESLSGILSIGYIVSLLVSAVVAFIAIVISDKLISHNIEAKHSFILAIVALFIAPIVGTFAAPFVPIPYFGAFILPLLVWIGLGQVLLSAEAMTKLKVTVIAFVVYIVLSLYLTPMIRSLIPF